MTHSKTAKQTGDFGERCAEHYLRKNGYKILARNFRADGCEIDLIVRNSTHLVFVEVKCRTQTENSWNPRPAAAVDRTKQLRLIHAARLYPHKQDNLRLRFDIVEVYLSPSDRSVLEIRHIENAFGA